MQAKSHPQTIFFLDPGGGNGHACNPAAKLEDTGLVFGQSGSSNRMPQAEINGAAPAKK